MICFSFFFFFLLGETGDCIHLFFGYMVAAQQTVNITLTYQHQINMENSGLFTHQANTEHHYYLKSCLCPHYEGGVEMSSPKFTLLSSVFL